MAGKNKGGREIRKPKQAKQPKAADTPGPIVKTGQPPKGK